MPVTRHPLASETRHLRGVPIDQATIARLETSLKAMTAGGADLAGTFYHLLFERHPETRPMFPADMTAQKKKLLDALVMVVENLRSPAMVRTRLELLGHNHVGYGTRPEHYPLVCACIVAAMSKTAGANWTGELQREWTMALELVSEAMLAGAAKMQASRPRPAS